MSRRLRLAAILAGLLAGLPILAVALAYAGLQTEPGRRLLAERLSALLSSPDSRIEIAGIAGSLPFHVRVADIRLSDRSGPWLRIHDAALDLVPADLLHRRLTVDRLAAAEIAVDRSPASSGGSSSSGIAVPQLPVALELRRLALPRLDLAPPLLGQPMQLAITGAGDLAGTVAHAELALRRTDGLPGQADLTLALDGAPARLSLAVTVAEPTGRVLADILGRADPLPATARLAGEGLLSDWHGRLAAQAGSAATISADLTGANDRFGATGEIVPGDLAPAALAGLIGDRVTFDVAGRAAGEVTLDRLAVTLAAGRLTGSGRYQPASNAITGAATLAAPDLARFAGLAGLALAGQGEARLTVDGTLAAPRAALALDADGLTVETLAVARLHATATAAPVGTIADRQAVFTLDGHAEGVGGAAVPEAVAGSALDWSVAGRADGAARRIELERASVSGLGLELAGRGTVAPDRADGHVDLTVADLARLAPLVGRPLAGDARLSVALRADGGATHAELQGRLGSPKTGIAPLDAVLGVGLTLDAAATRAADGSVALERLSAEAEHAKATLSGRLADGRVDGRVALALPALAPLAATLGQPGLAGAVTIDGQIGGTLDHASVRATVAGDRLASGAARLDRLTAEIAVADVAARAGTVDARFKSGPLDGRAELTVDAADPATLALPRLAVSAAGARIEGALRVALAGPLTSGTLTLHVPDLAPWSTLAGTPLRGAIDGRIALAAASGARAGQSATVALTAARLGLPGLELQGLRLDASAGDLLGRPSGRATLDIAHAAAGEAVLSATRLRVEPGPRGAMQVDLATSGSYRGPFRLALGGDVGLGAATRVHLARLDGQVAGQTVTLARPLDLTVAAGRVQLDQLALGIGSGSLTGSASLDRSRVAARLAASGLPVGALAALGGVDGLSGRLGFTLDLSGTPANPTAQLALDGTDLRAAISKGSALPALAVTARAQLSGQHLSLDGRVAAPQGETIGITAALPVMLRLQPVAFALPPDGAITASATGAGRLEHLAEILPLGAHSVAGAYRIEITVAGTVALPDVGGRVAIDQARYDNLQTGTQIRNFALEVDGDHRRIVLRRLAGTDGAAGRLEATGSGDLAGGPLDLRLHLANFVLSRMDLAHATGSGDVTVGGTLAAPKVTAAITIPQAEVRLPDRLPPSVADLRVIEIDSSKGETAVRAQLAAAAAQQTAPPVAADLDVTVTLPGPVFVRGRGLDSEWRGRFTATGTTAAPNLVGGLTVTRGTVDVLGKTFTLQRGVIDFTGSVGDPQLDILAQAQTADVTAQVLIGGTVTRPTFKLTSTPELPQDEVLARVLFGRSVGQMTPAQGLQLAQAAASLAGGGPGVLDRLRSLTGLDRLSVGTNQAATAGAKATTALSGGKYVAEGVYVGVNQDVSTGQTRAEVQLELTPSLSVDSKVGAAASSSIGLTWRRDY